LVESLAFCFVKPILKGGRGGHLLEFDVHEEKVVIQILEDVMKLFHFSTGNAPFQ
jgi:hypothetical protein